METNLKNRIKSVIRRIGLTQKEVAGRLHISERMFSYYLNNGFPDDLLIDFCKETKTDYGWLKEDKKNVINVTEKNNNYTSEISSNSVKLFSIPVIGRVPAGFPDLKEEDILEFISIPDAPKGAVGLIVDGNSMAGDDIRDGDYVIFVKIDRPKMGEIIVSANNGGAFSYFYYFTHNFNFNGR